MRGQQAWKQYAGYWKTVPPSGTVILLTGVFCLFVALGLVTTMMRGLDAPVLWALNFALLSGVFAIGWAVAGTRRIIRLMLILGPLQVATFTILTSRMDKLPKISADPVGHALLMQRLRTEGVLATALIVAGYSLMVAFIRKEGMRVFGPMTEVRLAGEVHQALVPAFCRTVGGYEIYGASTPSGHVGGDLVDVMGDGASWTAYVADVAGHGISAGMVMAMVKSAARMGAPGASLSSLLTNLNRVLLTLSAPNVFVTFACITGNNHSNLTFTLAGHLPVLHYRKQLGVVEERSVSNLPLGVVADAEFLEASIVCEPQDILAVLTDGLVETSDDQGRELGLEPLKAALLESAGAPLEHVRDALSQASLKHGKQIDDQTVLLVRRS